MSDKERQQYNLMLLTLQKIATEYQSTDELRQTAGPQYGLSYREVVEMAYENIRLEASGAIVGIRVINQREAVSLTIT